MFQRRQQNIWGYFFIAPAIIGLVFFSLGPMLFSLSISFFQWDIVTKPTFIGLSNYKKMLSDPLIRQSLKVTILYTLMTVPLITVIPLIAAQLLNTGLKGMSVFRTIFYIPSIVPIVAVSAIWKYLYDPMYGPINQFLKAINLPPLKFINSVSQVLPSLAVMALWLSGNTVVIYLAKLQDMPLDLYEAASLDGAGSFAQWIHITLPAMSSVIFYNLVMAILGTMQTFTQVFIMTEGGPANGSLMYTMLVYDSAFKHSQMGYSSAMSWVFFVLMGLITFLVFGGSRLWVYDERSNG